MAKLILRNTECENRNVSSSTYSNMHTEPVVKRELYTTEIRDNNKSPGKDGVNFDLFIFDGE
jgi:hypothetical protein